MKIKRRIEKRKRLPIACDMSDSSIDAAIAMFNDIPGSRHVSEWYALECGSQLLPHAATIIAFRDKVYIDLNVTYDMDEWSIKREVFLGDWDNVTVIEQKVYSPGA